MILAFIVISSFLWNYFFLFDLFSHFYLQLLVLDLVFVVISLFLKSKVEIIISIAIAAMLSIFVIKMDISPILSPKHDSDWEIMFMNTYFWNKNENDIVNYIKKKKPSKLALVEPNESLFKAIKNQNLFVYSDYRPDSAESIAFFSNSYPETKQFVLKEGYPIWIYSFKDPDILIAHPYPPFDSEAYKKQKKVFAWLRNALDVLNNKHRRYLLVWDFNSSVYSRVFQKYFWDLEHYGIYTWATNTPLALPIDQAISNKPIKVLPWDALSSDHIPLHISFR